MRYLRFYKNDADFKTHEEEAGGTGNDVESVVPGIVKTLDERKMYFNPHDKEIRFHTLTINYKKHSGESLAQSSTKSIKYIPGVKEEIVVTPENIEGYVPKENKKTVIIPTDSVVDFIYSPVLDPSKPLTFKIISGGTINWINSITYEGRTISYSKDMGETWTDIVSTTGTGKVINVISGDIVMFKGDNITYATTISNHDRFGSVSAKFEVEGNIMSLINSTDFQTATTIASNYTFYCLFRDCTGLTSTEKLVLPATTLADNCYNSMFAGCRSLTTAPELPATALTSYCYYGMFSGCTSLITAPSVIPATTLKRLCCYHMFQNCTSLTTAPELPSTTLANSCYSDMFAGCTSLTTAPVLPATTLADNCYNSMFAGCRSLTTAPELPATTLASGCYDSMFSGCTSLTTAKELPATKLASYCYSDMFNNCKSLITAPALPATTLVDGCYLGMFEGCTSLTSAPSILPATALTNYCYQNMFNGCTSLITAPELPAATLRYQCYYQMFLGCTSLNYIKCLATNISASNCTYNWVNGVSSTGTFVKKSGVTWPKGNDGIPRGWTVEEE